MTIPATTDIALEPQPLAYAVATTDGPSLAALEPALARLLGAAVLSGLCVGSCFLVPAVPILTGVLHLGIYAAILFLGVRSGVELGKVGFSRPGLLTMDGLAAMGLVPIGLAPIGLWLFWRQEQLALLGVMILAIAFAMLAVASVRHRDFYRKLSYPVRAAGYTKTAKWLVGLGWTKSIYETLWLTCCAIPLGVASSGLLAMRPMTGDGLIYAALGGLFGCFGYALIWVVMMILHARLLRLSRLRRPTGFEVLMGEPT